MPGARGGRRAGAGAGGLRLPTPGERDARRGCPARWATPGRRRRPAASASAGVPPRWRAGAGRRGAGEGRGPAAARRGPGRRRRSAMGSGWGSPGRGPTRERKEREEGMRR